jgi:hypothetical protein
MLNSTLVKAIFHHGIDRSQGTAEFENSSESTRASLPSGTKHAAACGIDDGCSSDY